MSIGDLITNGNKGNNFPWQLKMLMGQQCACDQLTLANSILQDIENNTDTVEPLLAQILAAIQQGTDYEAALVVDANGDTWLEIRIWNGVSFDPPVYYLAGSNIPGVPVAPITYVNPNSYLAQIVSNTTGLATETTLQQVETNTSLLATETTLQSVETNTTGVARTPGILRPTGAGNVNTAAATFYSVSVANVGTADGSVLGGTNNIKPGEVLNFSGDALNNYFTSFAYNATGTEFIIIYVA